MLTVARGYKTRTMRAAAKSYSGWLARGERQAKGVGRRSRLPEHIAAVGASLLIAGPALAGPPGPSSAAYGFYGQITGNGDTVTVGPIAEIERRLPAPYDTAVAAGPVRRIVPLLAGTSVEPSLFIDAADFESHVASKGFGVDAVSTEADTLIKSLSLALNLNPLPPVAPIVPLPQPFLELSARRIASTAGFTEVFPRFVTDTGSADFGGLTVTGSLVGNKKLVFNGEAAKDTVLFHSPALTITLNRQTLVGLISCSPICVFTPYSTTTDAIDIYLDHADLDGRIVSGEIVLGHASAD